VFPRSAPQPPFHQPNPSTIPQRSSIRTTKPTIIVVKARSIETMKSGRPRSEQMRHHGTSARQNAASSVPTALAFNEFQTSPRISRAKLVVMPHEGQGTPVRSLKVQGGSPICRCVSIRSGWPSLP